MSRMKVPGLSLPRKPRAGRLPAPRIHRPKMHGPGHTAFPHAPAPPFLPAMGSDAAFGAPPSDAGNDAGSVPPLMPGG